MSDPIKDKVKEEFEKTWVDIPKHLLATFVMGKSAMKDFAEAVFYAGYASGAKITFENDFKQMQVMAEQTDELVRLAKQAGRLGV